MQVIYERCAGLGIYKKMIEACVLITQVDGTVEKLIQTFSTMITDLLILEEWLSSLSINHIVMESTEAHWYHVYTLLEEGRHIILVQPQHLQALSEHKMNGRNCEWLADLLRHDQLKTSFAPPKPIVELRDLLRYRKTLLAERTQEVNHLRKIMDRETTTKPDMVATGVSYKLAVNTAITHEQQATGVFEESAQGHLQRDKALHLALDKHVHQHQQFLLQRTLTYVEFCEGSLAEVQKEIEQRLALFEELVTLLQSIPCVHQREAILLLSEIGMDMSRFPTHKHLTSWAGVWSGNEQRISKRSGKVMAASNPDLLVILSEIANSITHSAEANYLTFLYWRTLHWKGKQRAMMAISYAILVISYYIVLNKKIYGEVAAEYFGKYNATRIRQYRIHRLEELGYYRVPLSSIETTQDTRSLLCSENTRVGIWHLFSVWAWIGLTSFGGGASSFLQIQREFTQKRNWITLKEISHFWNLCQIAPGTNQIALSILIGRKFAGVTGIIASLTGFLLPSAAITYLLTANVRRIENIPAMQAMWRGIIPATSGLMFLLALHLARPLIAHGYKEGWRALSISLTIILACIVALLFFKIAVIVVLLGGSLAGIILFTTVNLGSKPHD